MLTREGPFLSWLLAPLTGFANSGIMSPVKYWEIGADKLSAAGWSWGYCSAVTRHSWLCVVDAHGYGRRSSRLPIFGLTFTP